MAGEEQKTTNGYGSVAEQASNAPSAKSPQSATHSFNPKYEEDEWVPLVMEEGTATAPGPETPTVGVWDTHPNDGDVENFVNDVLKDGSINSKFVPDIIEKQLYKATVRLVLWAVYSGLEIVHGMDLLGLGHILTLVRTRALTTNSEFRKENTGIDEKILEQVAAKLLMNSAVNSGLIPDFIERQLYQNCFKLVARLVDTLANTFCVTVCGHDMRMYFEPSKERLVDNAAVTATASHTRIDAETIKQALKQAGSGTSDDEGEKGNGNSEPSVLQVQLMTGIYQLILGIMDDVFANTTFQFLNDNVRVDIVATGVVPPKPKQKNLTDNAEELAKTELGQNNGLIVLVLVFLLGLGIGVIVGVYMSP